MARTTVHEKLSEFSDDSTNPVTAEWDRNSENTPVFAVVSAVAEASGTDPLELPPLGEAIDPEALNRLFTSRAESAVDTVAFQFAGCDVVVYGNGGVRARAKADA